MFILVSMKVEKHDVYIDRLTIFIQVDEWFIYSYRNEIEGKVKKKKKKRRQGNELGEKRST